MNTRTCLFTIGLMLSQLFFSSCEHTAYDTGDGEYSDLRADFADVRTDMTKTLVSALLDNGEQLTFQPLFACSWAEEPTSDYRALLYYYPTAAKDKIVGYAAQQVFVLPWHEEGSHSNTQSTDPVHVSSVWVSQNRRYLNLHVGIMVGNDEEGNRKQQQIGVTLDSNKTYDDGSCAYHLTLRHAQNNVPEYYTSHQYLSLPLTGCQAGDTLHLQVNTYDGRKTYTIIL